MISLSESARAAIHRLVVGSRHGATGLRIMVDRGGCAGLKYLLGLERTAGAEDEVVDCAGVSLFVDHASAPLLRGLRIDFIEAIEGSGFVFDNPNAQAPCSCGKSFSA